MLTEFLKSIRGEKALWETIITGVDVCNFRLQGNTKDPFIPISLQPLHFEVFFCFAGHVVLKQQWNRVVVVRKQEILLLSVRQISDYCSRQYSDSYMRRWL